MLFIVMETKQCMSAKNQGSIVSKVFALHLSQWFVVVMILGMSSYFIFGLNKFHQHVNLTGEKQHLTTKRKTINALLSAGDSVPDLLVSAGFHDMRFPGMIRFVCIGRVIRKSKLFCHFHDNSRRETEVSFGNLHPIMSHYKLQYDGCFIKCPIPGAIKTVSPSLQVSLSQTEKYPGAERFPLIGIPEHPPKAPTIAACVSPMHNKVPIVRMIAWIEMNRLVGVNHFMIYDFEMNAEFGKLINYYQSKGIVSVLKWNTNSIPVSRAAVWPPPSKQVHYYGQFSAYNDCLYRLGNRFRFLMFTDLDEMIVPLRNITLNDYLKANDGDHIAEFRFRNTYVRADYPKDLLARKIDPDIASKNVPYLDFTRREKRILDKNLGAKVVVKFQNSLVMGVHGLIHKTADFKVTYDVPVEKALLFHYRSPPQYLNIPDEGQPSKRLIQLVPKLIGAIQNVVNAM